MLFDFSGECIIGVVYLMEGVLEWVGVFLLIRDWGGFFFVMMDFLVIEIVVVDYCEL